MEWQDVAAKRLLVTLSEVKNYSSQSKAQSFYSEIQVFLLLLVTVSMDDDDFERMKNQNGADDAPKATYGDLDADESDDDGCDGG